MSAEREAATPAPGECPVRYGARFCEALAFAARAHEGQTRKAQGAPYITHPLAVASLIGEYGGDEDQAIAGLLHDVIEDCGVTRAQIAEPFGERVAEIVESCTDAAGKPKPPWRERKENHLARVRVQEAYAKLVIAADKLHNASCILRDLRRASVGERVWSRFRAPRTEVLWYYRAMTDALRDGWDHELGAELARAVAELG